jgi:hypothetical protein
MSKSKTAVKPVSPTVSTEYQLSPVAPAPRMITTYFRPMSDVVDERLDEQHRRVMEVAGNLEAAKEAHSRCGLVCGVEVGKQTAALEATQQYFSLLKIAAETLGDIAKRIGPPAIWQQGADSMHTVTEGSSDEGRPAWLNGEVAHG